MNLSQHPETICVRFDLPLALAAACFDCPDEVASRHAVEKLLQDLFYIHQLDAFVQEGSGTMTAGHIFMLTDKPAAATRLVKDLLARFPVGRRSVDLLPFASLGWFDRKEKLWRTFHPATTRPFWTLLEPPEKIDRLMERGRAVRKLKVLLNE